MLQLFFSYIYRHQLCDLQIDPLKEWRSIGIEGDGGFLNWPLPTESLPPGIQKWNVLAGESIPIFLWLGRGLPVSPFPYTMSESADIVTFMAQEWRKGTYVWH